MEQEISSANVKPDIPMQNFDEKLIFDDCDEIEIRLPLITVLTFLNTPGGYLTQTFNSQTLRCDL